MEINNSPIFTTRNYGINNARVDDSIFCTKIFPFKNIKIENDCSFLTKNNKNVEFFERIGEKFDTQLRKNNNIILNFEISKTEENPLRLNFDFDKSNTTLVEQIVFDVKANVSAKIVVEFGGKANAYHNGLIKVNCESGAKVDVLVINDFEAKSENIFRVENTLDSNAELNFSIVDFANGNSITNFYSKLNGKNCKSDLNCVYVAGGDSFVDLNFVQDVFGCESEANIQTVGALLNESRKHFKGTINFEKGCKKSCGNEEELCLLLSKNAKSKALPMLLCTEEDVDGKHSSSVGKVSEKELFYIMSRGFSKSDAIKLVVKARFNVVLEKIADVKMKEKLIESLDRKMSYEEF